MVAPNNGITTYSDGSLIGAANDDTSEFERGGGMRYVLFTWFLHASIISNHFPLAAFLCHFSDA